MYLRKYGGAIAPLAPGSDGPTTYAALVKAAELSSTCVETSDLFCQSLGSNQKLCSGVNFSTEKSYSSHEPFWRTFEK